MSKETFLTDMIDIHKELYIIDTTKEGIDEDNIRDFDDIETLIDYKLNNILELVNNSELVGRERAFLVCKHIYNMNLYIDEYNLTCLYTNICNSSDTSIKNWLSGYSSNFYFHLIWHIPLKVYDEPYDNYYNLNCFVQMSKDIYIYIKSFFDQLIELYKVIEDRDSDNFKSCKNYQCVNSFTNYIYNLRDEFVNNIIYYLCQTIIDENFGSEHNIDYTCKRIRENVTPYILDFLNEHYINHFINFYIKKYDIYPLLNKTDINLEIFDELTLYNLSHYYNFNVNVDSLKPYLVPKGWLYQSKEELIQVFLNDMERKFNSFMDSIIMCKFDETVRADHYLFQ